MKRYFFILEILEMYYVYILKGDKYYVGYTGNLEYRMFQHFHGLCKTTKKLNVAELVGYFLKDTKEDALRLEKMVKHDGHINHWINHESFITINKKLSEI